MAKGIKLTHSKRKEHTQNLALGYEFYSLGVNIFRPLDNINVITTLEFSSNKSFRKIMISKDIIF